MKKICKTCLYCDKKYHCYFHGTKVKPEDTCDEWEKDYLKEGEK